MKLCGCDRSGCDRGAVKALPMTVPFPEVVPETPAGVSLLRDPG